MTHVIDLNFQGYHGAIASFIIPTNEGPVLIETGPHSTLPYLESGVSKLGYQLSDIKHVLLSHIHLDHAGAAWYLARQGAKIYVHTMGYRHLSNPERLMASAARIYGDQMDSLWGTMEAISDNQLVQVVDDQPIEIGNRIFIPWYTPGHAIHHIAWQLDETLFTGDVAGVKISNGPVMPPCPPPDIDIELWIESLDLIRGLELDRLQLTHFGAVKDIPNHLDKLQDQLIGWSQWIKPYWEAQTPASEITEPFQEFVAKYLLASGLSEAEIKIYEAANPSWMSVYGLLRYWERRPKGSIPG